MATLEALPIELVERIATLISTAEVGKLRLTCRELRGKASQGHYLQRFVTHNIDLSRSSLERAAKIFSEDNLSRKLKHLSLTAILHESANPENVAPFLRGEYWDPHLLSRLPKSACTDKKRAKEDAEEARKERHRHAKVCLDRARHQVDVEAGAYPALLRDTLLSIKTYCPTQSLESLTLKCVVENGDDLRWELETWDQQHRGHANHVSYLFATAFTALVETQLPIREMHIFSTTRFCSLACTELAAYLGSISQEEIVSVAKNVDVLSISVSRLAGDDILFARSMCCPCNGRAKTRPDEDIICHYHQCEFEEEGDNYCMSEISLGKFLRCFTNLKKLDLHQYEIELESDKYNGIIFSGIAHNAQFDKLRTLVLSGLNADETTLVEFLCKHTELESLDLRAVNLNEGQWHGTFTAIKNKLTNLNTLELRDLFEHKRPDNVTQPTTGNVHHFPPPPPPPPPLHMNHNPWVPNPPQIIPAPNLGMTDTYLNTLLSFRVMNVPAEHVESGGMFKTNKVVIKAPWISKADILYGFVSHAANKWKLEKRWNAKMMREYGPPKDNIIEI